MTEAVYAVVENTRYRSQYRASWYDRTLCFTCDLEAEQMNVQRCLIRELIPYEFELDHNAAEATKNPCCAKG